MAITAKLTLLALVLFNIESWHFWIKLIWWYFTSSNTSDWHIWHLEESKLTVFHDIDIFDTFQIILVASWPKLKSWQLHPCWHFSNHIDCKLTHYQLESWQLHTCWHFWHSQIQCPMNPKLTLFNLNFFHGLIFHFKIESRKVTSRDLGLEKNKVLHIDLVSIKRWMSHFAFRKRQRHLRLASQTWRRRSLDFLSQYLGPFL